MHSRKVMEGPVVHTSSSLRWPVLGPDGLLTGIDSHTAAFLHAWIIQAIRLQEADPVRAGQIRALLGFCPNKPFFNKDAVMVKCDE